MQVRYTRNDLTSSLKQHNGYDGELEEIWLRAHVVLSGGTILWRELLGLWRGVGGELRSLSDSEGSVSACGEPVSPTNSRRNLNLDRKSCHTTYHPTNRTQRHFQCLAVRSTLELGARRYAFVFLSRI